MAIPLTELESRFDTAAGLSGAMLDQYLQDLPPEVAAEVRRLLELREGAEAFFERAMEIIEDSTDVQTGSRVGHFDLLRPIGRGGAGAVYLALDRQLHRRVALKIVPGVTDRDAFLAEARAIASLRHPHVCQVYSAAVEPDGTGYLAMPFYDGPTVRDLLNEGGVDSARLREIATGCASGLAEAHRAGIVHRDIKPENLVLDSDGRLVILDFGIASASDANTEGDIAGTPRYLSPEGLDGTVRPSVDIWSFGVTLLELATGSVPDGSRRETRANALPRRLRQVVRRCLETDPAHRFQNGGELLAALEAPARRRKYRRHLAGVAAVAAVLLAVAMIMRPPLESIVVRPFVVADAGLEPGMAEAAGRRVAQRLDGLNGLSGEVRRWRRGLLRVEGRIEMSGGSPVLTATVRDREGRVVREVADRDGTMETLDDALDRLSKRVIAGFIEDGGTPEENYRAIANVGFPALREFLLGQHNATSFQIEQTFVPHFQRAVDLDPEFGLGWMNLAMAVSHYYRLQVSPDSVIKRAWTLRDQLEGGLSLKLEGDLAWHTSDFLRADSLYEDLSKIYPDDRYALLRWAELSHHFNYRLGRRFGANSALFARAHSLDPENYYGLNEWLWMLGTQGDWSTWDELAPTLLTQFNDRIELSWSLVSAMTSDDPRVRDEAINTVRDRGSLPHFLSWLPLFFGNFSETERIARTELASADDDDGRQSFRGRVVSSMRAQGDPSAGIEEFYMADRPAERSLMTSGVSYAPYAVYSPQVRQRLEETWLGETPTWVRSTPSLAPDAGAIREYFLGILALRDDRPIGPFLDRLDELRATASSPGFVGSLSDRLRGEQAFANREFESAVEFFARAEVFEGFPIDQLRAQSMRTYIPERVRRAEALLELDRAEEALDLLDTIGPGMFNTDARLSEAFANQGMIQLLRGEAQLAIGFDLGAREALTRAETILTRALPDLRDRMTALRTRLGE